MSNDIVPCPVCGSKDIEKVYANDGISGPGCTCKVLHEVCKHCGIMLSLNRKLLKDHCLVERSDILKAKIRELKESLKEFSREDIESREEVVVEIKKLEKELFFNTCGIQ